ncbi:succinate-semialdehyde dehydrogenase/glutarate-semialdehyde dehydrogenase [Neomicrococcus aestuarii]|uniref:Succinate-semialdehyde dehydrogenase/glutarate-semialdehyde dehydrogenase n=1 Tax=Neomicrococcus aestuarii TaxID=556325 RepID=A0A7W8WYY2_9MICC|nr:NAD-dependent succinate-semialdehyde dehydrogenase [Neomicrococcus aestuarii]MBB5512796.1 succinate-semialdehyde dehydrogenase/glutarate-semialdehyde dehydrogenase [Neomicrococcus aestuarii]
MSLEYRVQNPVTNEVVEKFPTATDEEIKQAVAGAAEAFKTWRNTTFAERAEILSRVADLLRERKGELAEIAALEMGKPTPAGEWEINFSADIIQFYADRAEKHSADIEIDDITGGKAIVRRLPLGPILGIMPWNYPYYQVARFAGPNLMNGNTVLLKHAEICPKSSATFAQIFTDAGLPEGVFTNIYATHDQIGDVIDSPEIQGVSLTGSERAGSIVAARAGKALKKCVLELGGTDAYVILDTDNVKEAAAEAWAKRIENVGQACTSNKRMIVMEDIYDEFVDAMVQIAESYKQGEPQKAGANEFYPLSSRGAAENLDDQVKRAVSAGANLRTGGELLEQGAYFTPAVLTDVPVGSESFYEEFFGPVAEIYKASSEQEAIDLANNSRYGLGGAVFSQDVDRAKNVAAQIDTGMVHVNLGQAFSPALPFGGIKRSGFGRELSVLAMDEFVNKQTFYVND